MVRKPGKDLCFIFLFAQYLQNLGKLSTKGGYTVYVHTTDQ